MALRTLAIKGRTEAVKRAQSVARRMDPQFLVPILREGAKPIRNEAERTAPVGLTRRLRRAVHMSNVQEPGKPAAVAVFVSRRDAHYASFVVRGTRPHIIRPKAGHKFLSLFGGRIILPFVHHPGAKAQRFFSQAVSAKRGESRKIIIGKLLEAIEKP